MAMRIHGNFTLEAPCADVFAAICDPDTLLAVIPGCREIEQISDTEYRGRIALRLPGIVGVYGTSVRLVDADEPHHAQLEGDVTGAPGSIKGRASFQLSEAGSGTLLTYDGQAAITGMLARLDGRFAEGLAESLISQGLGRLNARLQPDPAGIGGHGRAQPTREAPG